MVRTNGDFHQFQQSFAFYCGINSFSSPLSSLLSDAFVTNEKEEYHFVRNVSKKSKVNKKVTDKNDHASTPRTYAEVVSGRNNKYKETRKA